MKTPTIFVRHAVLTGFALLALTSTAFAGKLTCEEVFTGRPAAFVVDLRGVDPGAVLETSLELFQKNSRFEDSRQVMKKLVEKGLNSLSDQDIALLKATRKEAARLRSGITMTTEDHGGPKAFERFTKDLGYLNDVIAMKKSKLSEEAAKDVLKDCKKLDVNELPRQVRAGRTDDMREYFGDLLKESREIMSEKKVSIDHYHEVRKNLKEFMMFYWIGDQMRVLRGGDKNLVSLEYQYIFDLNEELGLFNDQLTEKVINGQADKNKTKIEFPKDLRKRVNYILNHASVAQ